MTFEDKLARAFDEAPTGPIQAPGVERVARRHRQRTRRRAATGLVAIVAVSGALVALLLGGDAPGDVVAAKGQGSADTEFIDTESIDTNEQSADQAADEREPTVEDEGGDAVNGGRDQPEVTGAALTVPAGLRTSELIDHLLELNPRFDRDELVHAVTDPSLVSSFASDGLPEPNRIEGTLAPGTYDVADTDLEDEARLLRRMVDTFDTSYGQLIAELGRPSDVAELGLTDYQIIVIASLVEEEAPVGADRPALARALYNRLLTGVPLQSDASVYYAAGKLAPEPLSQAELDARSPWNTYTTAGLPPTPIAAPSETALRAALSPANGSFIYWVRTDADGVDGALTFSATLDEHNTAVEVCRALAHCG